MPLLLLLMACDSVTTESTIGQVASTVGTVQLVYSGNVHGEIEPCG